MSCFYAMILVCYVMPKPAGDDIVACRRRSQQHISSRVFDWLEMTGTGFELS